MKSSSSVPPAGGSIEQASAAPASAANDVMLALLIESGVILSMACCYLIGNSNLGSAWLFRLNPLYALPFLLVFLAFCWYRLDFAIGLFPLALPFSFVPRPLFAHVSVDLAEMTLLLCLGVALVQLAWQRRAWRYWATWLDLSAALGPFRIPILLFALAALGVTLLTGTQQSWETLRLAVLEPVLYVCLMQICLQAHSRVERVLWSLFVAGTVLFCSLLIRAIFLQVPLQEGLAAGESSARFVRVFLTALAPLALALCVIGTWQGPGGLRTWLARVTAGLLCLLLLLSLSVLGVQSSLLALLVAVAFLAGAVVKWRRLVAAVLLLGALAMVAALLFWPGLASSLVGVHGLGDLLRDFPLLGPLGLLAMAALLLLFFWTFARLLVHLSTSEDRAYMRWIAIGLGGALAITVLQGLIDGMALAQSTWYLAWIFLGTLLLLRRLTNAAWRGPLWSPQPAPAVSQSAEELYV